MSLTGKRLKLFLSVTATPVSCDKGKKSKKLFKTFYSGKNLFLYPSKFIFPSLVFYIDDCWTLEVLNRNEMLHNNFIHQFHVNFFC